MSCSIARYHPDWAARIPYNVVLVQLDDGPRMFSNLVGDASVLAVGARVRAVFAPLDEGCALPQFAPETQEGSTS